MSLPCFSAQLRKFLYESACISNRGDSRSELEDANTTLGAGRNVENDSSVSVEGCLE
jgi:hypothetical protein